MSKSKKQVKKINKKKFKKDLTNKKQHSIIRNVLRRGKTKKYIEK